MTIAPASTQYIQLAPIQELPSPRKTTGAWAWMRANLFSSWLNGILTVICALIVIWFLPGILRFMIFDAVWTGSDREACLVSEAQPVVGACWAFVRERLPFFIYGPYPIPSRWRVDLFFVLLAVGIFWLLWLRAPRRGLGAIYFFVIMPLAPF